MPKVSVIIPVYNVEPYLKRVMDCLVNQTMKDLEFICIDDCSTDNSLDILKEYAQKDSRFKIISLDENKGAAHARNEGLKISRGEYLGFIDPDDAIDLNYYEELYKKAKENDYDIVKCPRKIISPNGENKIGSIQKLVKEKGLYAFIYEWTCAIYKASTIFENNITFPEGIIKAEDTVFLNRIILKAANIALIDNVFYYYYRRPDSLNAPQMPIRNIHDGLKGYLIILDDINNSQLYKKSPNDYIMLYTKRLQSMIQFHLYRNGSPECQRLVAESVILAYWKCLDINRAEREFPYPFILKYIKKKDTMSLAKYFNKYKSYDDFKSHYSFIEKFFSVKNSFDKKYKILKIFGISIRIKQTNKIIQYPEDKNLIHDKLMTEICEIAKENMSEIYYLRYANKCVYIFSYRFLQEYPEFSYVFLQKQPYLKNGCIFKILKKSCKLYKKHKNKFKDNLICQKYIRALNGISSTEITVQNGELYLTRDFIGKENAFFIDRWTWGYPKPRKYVKGLNFGDYIKEKDYDEKVKLLKYFYDWLFNKYKIENSDLISGEVADCHLNNFILSEDNKFHFIDPEWKSNLPVEKSYCIFWSLLKYGHDDLYKYFIELYKLEDHSEEYKKFQKERFLFKDYFGEKKWKIMKKNNKKLVEFYVGDKSIK